MSSGFPSSVRQLYAPPTDDFLFLPPTLPPSGSPPSPRFSNANSSSSPVLILPERSRTSTTFPHLSPSILTSAKAREQLLWATAGSLFSSFIAQPFEAGKVLSQVQYLPRRPFAPKLPSSSASIPGGGGGGGGGAEDAERGDDEEDADAPNDEEDAQAYFEELIVNASGLGRVGEDDQVLGGPSRKEVDADGYVLRTEEDGIKMEWVLRRGESNGPWAMTKRLWNGEGPTAPWKGFWTSVLFDSCTHYLPPLLQTILIPLTISSSSHLRQTPTLTSSSTPLITLLPYIASHSLSGFILSPLDLLRTRLIVQSSSRKLRTYSSNPAKGLVKLVEEEGGWWNTYFHPTLFWPTFWDITLRSLVSLATPIIIEQTFHISLLNSPMSYRALEAVLNIAGLLVTLPIETARRRLQVQSRSQDAAKAAAGFGKTCVDVRPRPYVGLMECIWRIASEENGSGGEGRFGGIKQLYRGFGLNFLASSAVLALESVILATGRESGGSWREI